MVALCVCVLDPLFHSDTELMFVSLNLIYLNQTDFFSETIDWLFFFLSQVGPITDSGLQEGDADTELHVGKVFFLPSFLPFCLYCWDDSLIGIQGFKRC